MATLLARVGCYHMSNLRMHAQGALARLMQALILTPPCPLPLQFLSMKVSVITLLRLLQSTGPIDMILAAKASSADERPPPRTGVDPSDLDVAYAPNSLLLELPDGWYLYPPLDDVDAFADAEAALAMQRQRTSSVRARVGVISWGQRHCVGNGEG